MSLLEEKLIALRELGFMPFRIARHNPTTSSIELQGYPYEKDGEIIIAVRATPHDSTTFTYLKVKEIDTFEAVMNRLDEAIRGMIEFTPLDAMHESLHEFRLRIIEERFDDLRKWSKVCGKYIASMFP